MLLLKIYRFLCGKLAVYVGGDFCERILNLCAHNGIAIWGIKRRGGGILFYMNAGDFSALRNLIRGSGLKAHIVKKRGLPFVLRRYRRRWGLAAGLAVYFLLLQFLSGFVWNIKVSGNEKISEKAVISALAQIGIKEGTRISKINAWDKRVELLQRLDGVSWAGINIEGCELTVDMDESQIEKIEQKSPSNLFSDCDGVVKSIEVKSGSAAVKTGDLVVRGQLLVSGVVELSTGRTHLVKSCGTVNIETSEDFAAFVPYSQKIKQKTGEKITRYAIDLFGLKIPLYLGKIPENYIRRVKISRFERGGSYIPIYLYRADFSKIAEKNITLSREEAIKIAEERLEKLIKNLKIVNISRQIAEKQGGIEVTYSAIFIKNAAIEENLIINDTNHE